MHRMFRATAGKFLLPFLLFLGERPALSGAALLSEEGTARQAERQAMVDVQLRGRGIRDERVLAAMNKVERHRFVPEACRDAAYDDRPLPIGYGQTISQPYIVAYMTEALGLTGKEKVLEIGTGSGYQAAVLAETAGEVFSIEVVEPLAAEASARLAALGYSRVHVHRGDGFEGWPEEAPFDAILVTAAPSQLPEKLVEQLKAGGRLVVPVGSAFQNIYRVTKSKSGTETRREKMLPVSFVPMVHEER